MPHNHLHALEHVDGTDDIRDATNALKGLATAAQITALEANTAHAAVGSGNPHAVTLEEARGENSTLSGGVTLGGDLDAGSTHKLVSLPTPTNDGDAATKGYCDATAEGLDPKDSVKALADSNQTLANLPSPIDGESAWSADERILLTNQTSADENGIWEVKDSAAWERPDDFDTGAGAAGAHTFVEEGTTYGNTGWTCTSDSGSDVIDTNNLAFTQFSGPGSYSAGDGLDLTGIDFSVDLATNPGLEISGAKLQVKAAEGIALDANGANVDLVADKGLEFSSSQLQIKIDDTPDTLDADADGLKVVGLPSLFKINGVAVGADVTTANIDDLCDGSDADALHDHPSLLKKDGSRALTSGWDVGAQDITNLGELGLKLISQAAEPTLGADGNLALWKDTDDSNRMYLLFRRGVGDHVSVELG